MSDQGINEEELVQEDFSSKREILTIDVHVTGAEMRKEGRESQQAVFFTGSCDNEYFKGTILPGAEDVQDYVDGQVKKLRADYTLEGVDHEGDHCRIHIVNTNVGSEFKPQVETDSRALAFLNGADLTAALEFFEGGLTVRIFA